MAKPSQPANDRLAEAPLTVISHVRVRKGYEAIVRDMLQKLVIASRAEPGCLEYSLHESITDPTLYVIYQVWDNEQALAAHSNSQHTAGFRRAAPGVLDGPIANTKWRRVT